MHGTELWRSGGTAADHGRWSKTSTPARPPALASTTPGERKRDAVLRATDGFHGTELWQSNGTAAGTVMVKDINPGPKGSYPYYMTNSNGTLFFEANDGVRGQELWILGPLPKSPSGAGAAPQLPSRAARDRPLHIPSPLRRRGAGVRGSQRPPRSAPQLLKDIDASPR